MSDTPIFTQLLIEYQRAGRSLPWLQPIKLIRNQAYGADSQKMLSDLFLVQYYGHVVSASSQMKIWSEYLGN